MYVDIYISYLHICIKIYVCICLSYIINSCESATAQHLILSAMDLASEVESETAGMDPLEPLYIIFMQPQDLQSP